MSEPKFDNIEDVKEWAEKLEFINQLPKEDYEKFKGIYSRILFFSDMFEKLDRLRRNLKQAAVCVEVLKPIIDSGELERAVDLSERIVAAIREDD